MRKSSVSHQLTKTARRLSTALAPQLTKIDTVFVLQQYTRLYIRISCIEKVSLSLWWSQVWQSKLYIQLQEAIKQYVFHSGKLFNPVEFEVRTSDGTPILVAQFSAEDIDLFEGQKRLLSISINNPTETNLFTRFAAENSSPTEAPVLAKVRHPYSGFKLFEVSQDVLRGRHESWQITGTMDELNKCQILSHTNAWRQMLNFCGFVFAAEWWSIEHDERRVGQVRRPRRLHLSHTAEYMRMDI